MAGIWSADAKEETPAEDGISNVAFPKGQKDRSAAIMVQYYTVLRNVVDSIQAINGQNADKIIGLRVLNSLKTHKQS